MGKVKQTKEELFNHLREQIQFLRSSCNSFDSGFTGEAKRLAVTIRLLVHDKSRSISLLSQLKSKDIYYFSTAVPYDPKNLLPHMGLIGIKGEVGPEKTKATYFPFLDEGDNNHWVTFNTWWNNEIILDDRKKKFSRKDLVLTVANKDGGAHVDPDLDEAYRNLSRSNTLGWEFFFGGKKEPMTEPELYSVRQIAHEMLRTLRNKFPDLF